MKRFNQLDIMSSNLLKDQTDELSQIVKEYNID